MTTPQNPTARVNASGATYRVSVKRDANGESYLAIAEITLVGNRKWEVTVIRVPEEKIAEFVKAVNEAASRVPRRHLTNDDWLRPIQYYSKGARTT